MNTHIDHLFISADVQLLTQHVWAYDGGQACDAGRVTSWLLKTSRQHTYHCSKILKFTVFQHVLPAAAFSRSAMLWGRPERVNTYNTAHTTSNNAMQILHSAGLQCQWHYVTAAGLQCQWHYVTAAVVHAVSTDIIPSHLVNGRMLKLRTQMRDLCILALWMHLKLILESTLTHVADCEKHGPHPGSFLGLCIPDMTLGEDI